MNRLIPPVSQLKDADMRTAPAALVRAAQRVREIAALTGTPLILAQHGKAIEKIITADMIASVSDKE